MTHDDLDPLLSPTQPAEEPVGLRERLFARSVSRLQRRSWRRITVRAAALAACYVAGIATWWAVRPAPETRVVEVVRIERIPVEPSPPESEPGPLPRSGTELELLAEQTDGPKAAELFRKAGDRFLNAEGNYQAALRCYTHYLDLTPESELVVDHGNDNWMLLALKNERLLTIARTNERRKEQNDADHDG